MTALREPPVRVAPSPPPAPGGIRRHKRHLRNDIVGGAFTISFFVMVVLFVIAFVWQRDGLTSAALDRVAGVASVQEGRIEDYLDDGIGYATLIASRPGVIGGLTEGTTETIETVIDSYKEIVDDVVWISVYSPDLELVTSTEETPFEVDPALLESAAVEPQIGDVVPYDGAGRVHLVAVRVGPEDAGLGIVVLGQSITELESMSGDYTGLGETGETVLAQAGPTGGAVPIVALRALPGAAMAVEVGPDRGLPINEVLEGRSFLSADTVDYRGVDVVAAGRHIATADWALVVKIDRDEAMAPLGEFIRTGTIALILGSMLAGFLAWQVARQVRGPILEIKDAAMAIARGDRDRKVPNERGDEIGDLVESFNGMVGELNLLTGNLENQVVERTAELELRNRELRTLMDAKETFLAGVSHEVRGPLTAMMGFLELARDDSFDESIERGPMLDAAMQQADEVLILIEDLLAAARAESGTLKLAAVRVNLQAQVAQVIEGLTSEQAAKVDLDTVETQALGDPSRARQIIRNLVSNAFRYGGPEIRIASFSVEGWSVVTVRDNGEGIPEDEREQIFHAFGQASSGRKVTGSVGIGLHVSRQLAELMAGEIDYEYVDGWSVFALRLPAYEEKAPAGV